MTVLLVCGAPPVPGVDYGPTISDAALVFAVDAGVEVCRRAGRVPDAVIGDLDSATPESIEWASAAGAEMITLPAAKSISDLDAALDLATGRGHTDITLTAVFGGRVDHELALIGSLARASFADPRLMIRIREPAVHGWVRSAAENPPAVIQVPGGDSFSVLGLLGPAVVSIVGAEYPIERHRFAPLSSLGVGNMADPDGATVTLSQGTVLVLVNAQLA